MGMSVRSESGQMTLEFMVSFPLMLIVALIMVNVLLFLSECASFDRMACDAVRIYATSPAYGQTIEQSCAQIESSLEASFDKEYLGCTVMATGDPIGHTTYTATLSFSPTLFGMGLRQSFLGIDLPALNHSMSVTIDAYRPGVLL